MEIITYAVPVFIMSMAAEWWWSRRLGRKVFTLADTITNLTIALFSEIAGLLVKVVQVGAYALVFDQVALTTWPANAGTWIIAFLGVDLCYYWFHRMSHEWNGMWIFHTVHHQSEEYNLSVALRQSAFGSLFGWVFYVPLAMAGVPPLMFATCYAINLVYQFFIHTRLVDRLGWWENWLNTPSHHRVHHGINTQYLDKNYAGVLIIWDRLFGTFVAEGEPVTFGTVKPYRRYNAILANLDPLAELLRQMRRAPSLGAAVRLWLRPPGWDYGDTRDEQRLERALAVSRPEATPVEMSRSLLVIWAGLAMAMGLTVTAMVIKPLGLIHLGLALLAIPLLQVLAFPTHTS